MPRRREPRPSARGRRCGCDWGRGTEVFMPDGRAIPATAVEGEFATQFQSAPGRWAGRYQPAGDGVCPRHVCFNPRPAVGPGDTREAWQNRQATVVSIRARPLGRAIRGISRLYFKSYEFQSAPGRWAGRYLKAFPLCSMVPKFQSAPGRWAGRYKAMPFTADRGKEFQSAPGRWAGRYPCASGDGNRRSPCFNPRPAVGPGDTPPPPASCCFPLLFQSAPGRWAGRYLLPGTLAAASPSPFQSAPGRWAGRYAASATSR